MAGVARMDHSVKRGAAELSTQAVLWWQEVVSEQQVPCWHISRIALRFMQVYPTIAHFLSCRNDPAIGSFLVAGRGKRL
jgi:hypothetical protein